MRKLSYWCAAGGSRDRFTALQNGLIDATVLTGAFVDRAKAAGMPVLLDLGDLEDSFATVSLLTSRTLQNTKRSVVRGFLQGISEAIYIFKSDPALGQKSLSKWMRTQDKGSARKRLPELRAADFVSALYRTVRRPSRCRRPGEQLAPNAKGKKAQEFVNEDILRELDKQGFFKSLQKK